MATRVATKMAAKTAEIDHDRLANATRSAIEELNRLAEIERERAEHAQDDELRDDHLIRAERYASRAWSMNEGYIRNL